MRNDKPTPQDDFTVNRGRSIQQVCEYVTLPQTIRLTVQFPGQGPVLEDCRYLTLFEEDQRPALGHVCLSVGPETDSSLSGQVLRDGAGGVQAFEKGFLRKVNVLLQSARLFRRSIVHSHSNQRRMTVLTGITLPSSDECQHVRTLMAGDFAMEDDPSDIWSIRVLLRAFPHLTRVLRSLLYMAACVRTCQLSKVLSFGSSVILWNQIFFHGLFSRKIDLAGHQRRIVGKATE